MSMADALLHERQEKDDKTRQRVRYIMTILRNTDGGTRFMDMEDELEEVFGYLDSYASGGQLV